jgi:predicted Zn-dependent peptidase
LLLGASAEANEPSISFERYRLPNGLTVILSEDHRLPQVAVDIWYHVGASRQSPGRSGFAHLFEHMMFSGAKHIGPEPFRILESIGTVGGAMANGTTEFDRTNYFETVAASELPTALWLESDRMGFLLETLDSKKLDIQKDVVSNERRQSIENVPYAMSELRTCDLLYPLPHPYFDCQIGTIHDIQSATVEELRSFFRQFYGPNNASLAIVGDFDPSQIKPLIQKYFGPIPRGPDVGPLSLAQPKLTSVVREQVDDKVAELPAVALAWNGVKPFDQDEAAGDVLATILGTGRTSRLYKELVHRKQVAESVQANDAALELGGYFSVSAVARVGHSSQELLTEIDRVLHEVKNNGVTSAEVERAKRKLLAEKWRNLERIGGFGGKADLLNEYQTFVGDPGYLGRDIARYQAVTPQAVQAFARKFLPDDRRLILETVPQKKTASLP